jgi:hypothetical protein
MAKALEIFIFADEQPWTATENRDAQCPQGHSEA